MKKRGFYHVNPGTRIPRNILNFRWSGWYPYSGVWLDTRINTVLTAKSGSAERVNFEWYDGKGRLLRRIRNWWEDWEIMRIILRCRCWRLGWRLGSMRWICWFGWLRSGLRLLGWRRRLWGMVSWHLLTCWSSDTDFEAVERILESSTGVKQTVFFLDLIYRCWGTRAQGQRPDLRNLEIWQTSCGLTPWMQLIPQYSFESTTLTRIIARENATMSIAAASLLSQRTAFSVMKTQNLRIDTCFLPLETSNRSLETETRATSGKCLWPPTSGMFTSVITKRSELRSFSLPYHTVYATYTPFSPFLPCIPMRYIGIYNLCRSWSIHDQRVQENENVY